MPASPLAIRSSGSVRWALVIEPVSSATEVASAAPPSIPPPARSPSIAVIERWCCWASTSVGREQRGLAAGVDDAQHRPQRDQGLAGADLALEQPVHRVRLGEVVLDLRADLALAAR